MKKKRVNLNKMLGDRHPLVRLTVDSATKQKRKRELMAKEEKEGYKENRFYGRCGKLVIGTPNQQYELFVEYVNFETNMIFGDDNDE